MGILDNLQSQLGSPDMLQLANQLMQMGQKVPMFLPDGHGGFTPNPQVAQMQQGFMGGNNNNMMSMLANIFKKPASTATNPAPQQPAAPVPQGGMMQDPSTPNFYNNLPIGTPNVPAPQYPGNTPLMPRAPQPAPGQQAFPPVASNLINGQNNPLQRIQNAIAMQESHNNYSALGKVTPSGDRAYGKYQVMGANIPQWTQQYFGRALTPQEFLTNPQAQDTVAQGQMGQLYNRYRNPQDVASVWFSGRPLAGNSAYDPTSRIGVPQYVSGFNRYYNQG